MSRFIPKTQESDTIFQAYLVDGIARWNESRSMAVTRRVDSHSCSSSLLKNAANQLAQELLGRNLVDHKAPWKYTGELIGVEYLYERADITLEDYKLSISALETEDVPMAEDEGLMETQDFEDLTVPTLETATSPVLSSAVSLDPNSALHSILTVPTSHSCPPAAPLVQGTESAAPVCPPGQTSDPAAVKPFRISNVCSYSEDTCSLEAGPEVQSPTIKKESDPDDSTDTLVLVLPPDTTVTAQISGSDSSSSTPPQEQPVSANLSSVSLSLSEGQVYVLTTAQPDSLGQVLPAKLSYILPATVNQATAGPSQPKVSGPRKPDVPYTTQWYRKKKMQNEKAGIHTRKYVRYTDTVMCKKCQKERKPPTHQQYYGNWYCEETATVPFADWMAKLSARGYGKKKTRK
ncbi:uncharacterized protein LOC134301486 [Trichomycterus rosablanca]|uniref:uncharacterized protein LOC134301486 n=1 Tax=Trichomycterus rosablanca TaxID=2290929 RepID=UPI002F3544F1